MTGDQRAAAPARQRPARAPRVLRPPLPGPSWLWVPRRPRPATAPTRAYVPGHRRAPRESGRVGITGIAAVAAGALMLIVSFTSMPWRHHVAILGGATAHLDLAAIRHNLAGFPVAGRPAATVAYFGWLCWALLIALVAVGVVANLPTRSSDGPRVVGFCLGLIGAAFTYYALTRYAQATHDLFGTRGGALDNADIGVWFALFGYLLSGVGSAIGPRGPKVGPRHGAPTTTGSPA